MKQAITTVNMDAIKTAAAATSLINFIFSFGSLVYKSHNFSIAVLIASSEITKAETSKTIDHSIEEI